MRFAAAIGAVLLACAPAAHAADPSLLAPLLDIARADRIGYRLDYLQHARYGITDIEKNLHLSAEDRKGFAIDVSPDGKHWSVSGNGIVIKDGVVTQSRYAELRPKLGALNTIEASQWAHQLIDLALDAPLSTTITTPELAAGAIEYYEQMMRILNTGAALDAFRADETIQTMRRVAKAPSHPVVKDEWNFDLRVDNADGHVTIISAGADSHFEPSTWNEPLREANPREDLVMTDGKLKRGAYLSEYFQYFLKQADVAAAKAASPKPPYRVGGDVKAPVAVSTVDPLPPDRRNLHGIIVIETVIDEHGDVSEARVLKGLDPGFDETALKAIRQWKFKPGTLNGKPVPVFYNLTVQVK